MTKKEFDEAISRLNDRYLLENMTNELYLQLRKTIETTYLKSLYKKKMKEQMKETVIVQSFNLLQKLKVIVERQQTQIDLLVQEVDTLKKQLNN